MRENPKITSKDYLSLSSEINEEMNIDSDFSEIDMSESDDQSEKRAICSSFSEDCIKEPDEETEEINIDDSFSENSRAEPDESSTEITLADFIHEHYFDLESIFTAYMSMTDNPDETELLEEFQNLLYQTKEAERNKARFR